MSCITLKVRLYHDKKSDLNEGELVELCHNTLNESIPNYIGYEILKSHDYKAVIEQYLNREISETFGAEKLNMYLESFRELTHFYLSHIKPQPLADVD